MKKFRITVEYAELLPDDNMFDVIDFESFECYGVDKYDAFNNAKEEINEYTFKNGYNAPNFERSWSSIEVFMNDEDLKKCWSKFSYVDNKGNYIQAK